MDRTFGIVGVSLQTAAGLIFIFQQALELNRTALSEKVRVFLNRIVARLSISPMRPQISLVLFAFVVFFLYIAISAILSGYHDVRDIIFALLGGVIFLLFCYGVYNAAIMAVLGFFFKSRREFINNSYIDTKHKSKMKIRIDTRYVWDIDLESEEYKHKYNIANLIMFLICVIEGFFAWQVFSSNLLSSHSIIIIVLGLFFILGILFIVPVFIITLIYLLGLICIYIFKFILRYFWIILVVVWLSGGIFLLMSYIYYDKNSP